MKRPRKVVISIEAVTAAGLKDIRKIKFIEGYTRKEDGKIASAGEFLCSIPVEQITAMVQQPVKEDK